MVDLNYPLLYWDYADAPILKPGCNLHRLYKDFTEMSNENSLSQMMKELNKQVLALKKTTKKPPKKQKTKKKKKKQQQQKKQQQKKKKKKNTQKKKQKKTGESFSFTAHDGICIRFIELTYMTPVIFQGWLTLNSQIYLCRVHTW